MQLVSGALGVLCVFAVLNKHSNTAKPLGFLYKSGTRKGRKMNKLRHDSMGGRTMESSLVRRWVVKVVSATLALSSLGTAGGLAFSSANAAVGDTATVAFSDVLVVDPKTSAPALNSGVVGDTATVVITPVAGHAVAGGTVAIDFAGAAPVNSSSYDAATRTATFTIPEGAETGNVTVTSGDTAGAGITATVPFFIWPNHDESYVMPNGHLNVSLQDLTYILDQIKFSEATANRTATAASDLKATQTTPSSTIVYPFDVTSSTRCLTDADLLAPQGASNNSSLTFAGGVITVTTVGALGVKAGDTVSILGATPASFNKTNLVVASVLSSKSFTLTSTGANPAATATVKGSVQVTSALPYGKTGLSGNYPYSNLESYGMRNIDGACNNITDVKARTATNGGLTYNQTVSTSDTSGWGAGDQNFIRLGKQVVAGNYGAAGTTTRPLNDTMTSTQDAYQNAGNFVVDPTPRLISNLISDQTDRNPAAVAAATQAAGILYGQADPATEVAVNATSGAVSQVQSIPNVTADYNVSAGYNSWFTLFGQFFDHGLDLVPKGGSSVYIPLDQTDPVYVPSSNANYMVLTRAADPNNNSGDSLNITTPYIDQSQTYGSHASADFFLREYRFDGTNGAPIATGRLVDGTDMPYTTLDDNSKIPSAWLVDSSDHSAGSVIRTNAVAGSTLTNPTGGKNSDTANKGLAQWKDIKAQARLLGIKITDFDVNDIPVVATDAFGKFVADPATGFPMVLMTNGSKFVWASGNANNPIKVGGDDLGLGLGTFHAVSSGHPFINDTMGIAVPFAGPTPLTPDADTVMNSPLAVDMVNFTYDDESLDVHYIAGDGRVNENIGLSSIHSVFHSEHNTVAADITDLLEADGGDPLVSSDFRSEWQNADGTWNGDRVFSAAKWITEMEYQHMVYDEFVRRISPSLPIFIGYDPTINAGISAEFASAVYRLGHSMLNETIARSNPGSFYDPTNNQDVSLITGFINPSQARLARPAAIASASGNGSSATYTLVAGEVAPKNGEVVSVAGMANTNFNILSGVIASHTSDSFTISSYYPPGGNGSALSLSAGSSAYNVDGISDVNTVSEVDSTSVAKVAIDDPGSVGNYDYSPMTSAAIIAQGMSSQRGNEIDEFVTDAVRNNLLGLPLDLASLNLTRGRDTQLPTLNQYRAQNNASLPAYTSWTDYFAKMRYPESGVNFVAAYGTHPSLISDAVGTITGASAVASGGHLTITYTASSTDSIVAGDTVAISGLSAYNYPYAIVDSVVDGTHFVVKATRANNPLDVKSFSTKSAARTYRDSLVSGSVIPGSSNDSISGSGTLTLYPTTTEEKRAYATAIVNGGVTTSITDAVADDTSHTFTSMNYFQVGQHIRISGVTGTSRACWNTPVGQTEEVIAADGASFTTDASGRNCAGYSFRNGGSADYVNNGSSVFPEPPADSRAFLTSTAGWASTETGIDNIDMWIGGLAENPGKQPITPPMLGVTFQHVFEDQMLKMQNGDRFYYLARTAGMNVGQEIPAQKFTDIVRRNTPSAKSGEPAAESTGILGMNSPGFAISDCAFVASNVPSANFTDEASCGSGTMSTINNVYTHTGLDNVTGFGDPGSHDAIALAGGAGDDGIFGGDAADFLSGGISGGDLIDGAAGNDLIIGGPGEDLIKGGPGNDNINVGESQIGDIADGGSGSDFIHTGNATGATASLIGENGNDYIQGAKAADIALFGGEGADWMEGKADIDTMFGDGGLVAVASLLSGSDDIVDGQAGNDLTAGDAGNDIMKAGNGTDIIDGGFGYDFVSYENMVRHDNGATLPPAAYVDLGGLAPNPLTMPADAYANLEGVSGSVGDDIIISGQGQNITIPTATGITGVQGSQTIIINAPQPEIVAGMKVTGAGIGANAFVFGAVQNAVGAVTTTQVTLTVENTATVTGPLTFTLPTITNADYIIGLKPLLQKTIGWNAATNSWGGSVANANGSIILGGDGSDNIQLLGGSNVVDGSKHIRTCILVDGYTTNSDTACADGQGYSTMSKIADAVDAGTVNAGDMRIVRELVDSTVVVTKVEASGTAITYTTASNPYAVGQKVSVSRTAFGSAIPVYDVANATVTGVTATTFTVASTAPATVRAVSAQAQLADVLTLAGAQNTYTIARVYPLPAGVASGYTITDVTGTNTVYNVQSVSFAAAAPIALSGIAAAVGLVPSAPQNATASADSATSVLASWNAPATDSSSAVRRYTARAYNSATGNNVVGTPCTVTAPATSCAITGLPAGQALFVDVVASSLVGDSAPSARAVATPVDLAGAPSAPRNVRVFTNGATTRLQVAWDAPTNAGASAITSYVVTTNTTATGSVTRATTCAFASPTDTTCILTLPAGGGATQNWISVQAVNGTATSAASGRVRGTASATAAPAAPTSVTATPNGSGTVDVAWNAPAVNGATAISGYGVRVYDAAAAGNLLADIATGSNATSYQVTGLTDGTQYWFTVYAMNAGTPAGGTASARVASQDRLRTANALTGVSVPSAAVGVTNDVDSNGDVHVLWSDPVITGGGSIAGYDVDVLDAATGVNAAHNGGTSSPSAANGLVTDGSVQYLSQVTVNGANGATQSDYQIFTPVTQAGPDAPTGLIAAPVANQSGQVRVTWNEFTTGYFGNAGASSVTSYHVYLMSQAIGGTVVVDGGLVSASTACNAGVCSTVLSGLSNTATYFATVAGVNDKGAEGPKALPQTTATAITAPAAPVVSGNVSGPETATITWTIPVNGGSPITGYTVTAHPTSGSGLSDVVVQVTSGTTTTANLTGLTQLTDYTVSVTATNAYATGDAGTTTFTTQAVTVVPSSPTMLAVTITPTGAGNATLSWLAPVYTGSGGGLTGFQVRVYDAVDSVSTVATYSAASNVSSQLMSGLTFGRTYYVTVVAQNIAGSSAEPTRLSATPIGAPATMAAPTVSVTGVTGAQRLNASWTQSLTAVETGGSVVTSYTVAFTDVTANPNTAAGTCTVVAPATTCSRPDTAVAAAGGVAAMPALVLNHAYKATVSAVNARGTSTASALSTAPATYSSGPTPNAPVWPQWSGTAAAPLSSVNLGSGKVILFWNRPTFAGTTATDTSLFSYQVKLYTTVAGAVQPTLTATLTKNTYDITATNAAVNSVLLTGLTNGTAYFASVTATNDATQTSLSPTRQRIAAAATNLPTVPRQVTQAGGTGVTATQNVTVNLNANPPGTLGGADVKGQYSTRYKVDFYAAAAGGTAVGSWTSTPVDATTTKLPLSLTGIPVSGITMPAVGVAVNVYAVVTAQNTTGAPTTVGGNGTWVTGAASARVAIPVTVTATAPVGPAAILSAPRAVKAGTTLALNVGTGVKLTGNVDVEIYSPAGKLVGTGSVAMANAKSGKFSFKMPKGLKKGTYLVTTSTPVGNGSVILRRYIQVN